jgi:hypothetical protein
MPAGDYGAGETNMPMAGSWALIAKASFVTAIFFGLTAHSHAQETPHLQFVSEYIRELGKVERLRSQAMNEMKDESNRMANCIRSATRFELELGSQISMMRGMRLKPPFETLPDNIASFYERKTDLYKRFSAGCAALMSAPKPGVDYDAMAAEAPKLTAEMEYIDTALFDAIPLVFGTLIDPVPDANNHMSKLIITNAQRNKLIADINSQFGAKLDLKDQGHIVGAAWVLRAYLGKEKGYSASDDVR